MKVKDILDRVTTLYNDQEYVRVPESHYLKFLDDALSTITSVRPDSHVKTDVVKLVAGAKQMLPTGGISLIDIYMNKKPKTAGSTTYVNDRAVMHVEREDLNSFDLDWAVDSTTKNITYINEFAYDINNPKVFWVNPPVGQGKDVYVEMAYSYSHEKYGEDTSTDYTAVENKVIDLPDTYVSAICNYMLYLLYSTDSTSQLDRQIATAYLQSFYQSLSTDYQSVTSISPDLTVTPTVNTRGNVNG